MNKLQSSSLLKGDGAADSELAVKRFDSAQWQHWVSSENQKWQRWILLVLALDTSGNIFLGLGSREGGRDRRLRWLFWWFRPWNIQPVLLFSTESSNLRPLDLLAGAYTAGGRRAASGRACLAFFAPPGCSLALFLRGGWGGVGGRRWRIGGLQANTPHFKYFLKYHVKSYAKISLTVNQGPCVHVADEKETKA